MSAPTAFTFETRVEALRRVLATTGWEFSIWGDTSDDEPRIRDLDAATRLGYAEPRMVRKLIKRIWPESKHPHVRSTVERTSMPRGGEREVEVQEYWLTEAELLKLAARSETPVAEAILDEMIAVFVAVRRHLLSTVAVVAHGRRPPQRAPSPPPPPSPGFVSPRVQELARWAAGMTGATPEALMGAALEVWATELAHQRQRGFGFSVPQGLHGMPGVGRWLLVPVSDGIYEVLERQSYTLGLKPSPALVAASASRVLQGLAIMVDALTACPREAVR